MIIIGIAFLYYLRIDNLRYSAELENTLSQSKLTMSEQDTTINELHNNVIELSTQAKEIQVKLEEMKKLEETVKGIVKPKDSPPGVIALNSKPNDFTTLPLRSGIGGDLNEVTNEEMIKLSEQTEHLLLQLDHQMLDVTNSLIEAKQYAEEKQHELSITPTIWPTESRSITSEFGYRIDPFSRRASFHSGLDISASSNTVVYATADGVVTFTGYDRSPGKYMIINHSNGLQTRYLHLNKIIVKEGDSITKGQEIALSGSTGRSTGPHVHYEIMKDGTPIDPTPYLND